MEEIIGAYFENFDDFIRQLLEATKAIQVGEDRSEESDVDWVLGIILPQTLCKLTNLLNDFLNDGPCLPRKPVLIFVVIIPNRRIHTAHTAAITATLRVVAGLFDEFRIEGKDYE